VRVVLNEVGTPTRDRTITLLPGTGGGGGGRGLATGGMLLGLAAGALLGGSVLLAMRRRP
jgi:hypothetical protein